jgi:uncharacterized 2Fe-2S/4Fe-4S cluster protein (DUF4445 family)
MGEKVLVNFQPDGIRGEVDAGTSVLEAARLFGVNITGICGGKQVCGKCKVILNSKNSTVSPISFEEKSFLSEDELSEGVRLACMSSITGDTTIFIPVGSRVGSQRLQTEGRERDIKLAPLISKIQVKIPVSTISCQGSDEDLLKRVLFEKGFKDTIMGLDIARELPVNLRKNEHRVVVTLNKGKEIIDIEPDTKISPYYGLAVDIGTTKVACYLHDLKDGKLLQASSIMNPQIFYGEDILARVAHTLTSERGLEELHRIIIEGINQLINNLLDENEVSRNQIYEMTVVGNTVMHHLFLNITPEYLGVAPFSPSISGSMDIKARELNIEINPLGNVHMVPIIAGFVGSDCLAAILATGLYQKSSMNLLMDIGTNTEIVLSIGRDIHVCSCASGPAFEGAHIRNGMRASKGAIERARIDRTSWNVEYKTIDDGIAKGICGSGIVDLVAEMLRTGIIDSTGRIFTKNDNVKIRRRNGVSEFVVEFGENTITGKDIVITQKDIREIQKAKAAIYTGSSLLMKKNNVKPCEIDNIYIAGAFGNYLDPENMRTIGMFPDFTLDKIIGVGNAAGTGSRMVLLSEHIRNDAFTIKQNIKYTELAAESNFMNEYTTALNMPHQDLDLFPLTMNKLLKSDFKTNH